MLLRNRIARAIAAGTFVLAAPMLASCGFNYATDKVYTPAPGANNRDHAVDVLNAVIVATADGEGTLVTTLSNNDLENEDTLTGITGEGVTAQVKGKVTVAPGGATRIANTTDDLPAASGDSVDGIKVTGDFKIGGWATLTLSFSHSDPVKVEVPIVANAGQWAGQDGDELTEGQEVGHSGEEHATEGDDH
ncbi:MULTISPECIES: hypothetical protein [unclassified Nocardioides]|uniref:hypothetical protein n=1 Tax=unclassified Nocardioides TaxID=2615069 RepID=UPI0006F70AA4|nr:MULTISPECIES: hypothetical protein [unclassified Nocardioides]KQY55386.1 hypothetical protein ASD30_15845 [Nocardioides sp. Root140]KQZ75506.1 hypothetical protein ASD66_03910 [Nocardioides sp. Root151]KRF14582.1 hypothetical protein ASH02_09700 [Nocardioides sp. Soil796]